MVKALVSAILPLRIEMLLLLLLKQMGEGLVKLGLLVLHFEIDLGVGNYGLNLINLLLVVVDIMQLCHGFRLVGHVLCKFILVMLTATFLLGANEALSLRLELCDAARRRVPRVQVGLAVRIFE